MRTDLSACLCDFSWVVGAGVFTCYIRTWRFLGRSQTAGKKVLPAQIRRNMAPFFWLGVTVPQLGIWPDTPIATCWFFLGEKTSPWLKNRIVFPYRNEWNAAIVAGVVYVVKS